MAFTKFIKQFINRHQSGNLMEADFGGGVKLQFDLKQWKTFIFLEKIK